VPNLGVVDIDKKSSLLLADIPGLIEGASQGKGLGDEFLRHVERTSVLMHLIDAYNDDVGQAYKTIIKELADYKTDLSERPQVVALTKIDGLDKKQLNIKLRALKKIVTKGTPVLAFSSNSREGLAKVLRTLLKQVEKAQKQIAKNQEKEALPVIGMRENDDEWRIEKTEDGFTVTGAKIERFASRTDFSNEEGVERLRDIMKKRGIIRELERQGIEPEQTINIGSPSIGELIY
jgi:GTP-binding protein